MLVASAPDEPRASYHLAWLHDLAGEERAAVPNYERALELGLAGEDRRQALPWLGSTYRALGHYPRAVENLRRGLAEFDDGHEFTIFLAMAFYNIGSHAEGMALLLNLVADTTDEPAIRRYQRAIRFYADKLDQLWDGEATCSPLPGAPNHPAGLSFRRGRLFNSDNVVIRSLYRYGVSSPACAS